MSCKILSRDGGEAQAIEWKQVAPPAGTPKPGNLYTPPQSAIPQPQTEKGEQHAATMRREEEQRLAESHRAGYAEGEAAAKARAAEQLRGKLEQLARAIENLAGFRARFRREAEPELVRLAIAIARRILRRELTIDPDALTGVLKAALEKINSAEVHRVRIHPRYAGVVRSLIADGMRVKSDYNHKVGVNFFRADLTVHWYIDPSRRLQDSLPVEKNDATAQIVREAWNMLDASANAR